MQSDHAAMRHITIGIMKHGDQLAWFGKVKVYIGGWLGGCSDSGTKQPYHTQRKFSVRMNLIRAKSCSIASEDQNFNLAIRGRWYVCLSVSRSNSPLFPCDALRRHITGGKNAPWQPLEPRWRWTRIALLMSQSIFHCNLLVWSSSFLDGNPDTGRNRD